MSEPSDSFRRLLAERSVTVTDRQLEQFELYYRELVDWNERMNLTAITEKEQVFLKHFYDSLTLSFYYPLDKVNMLADIGSGAGFPSIPLKIMFPHLRVTIVDSLQKRIGFLQSLAETLGLQDVECVHARAEDAARLPAHRDRYDLVTARAVARMNVLAEFCLPFARTGGAFVAMKGSDPAEELREAGFALKALGGEFVSDHAFELPHDGSGRHIVIVRKTKPTPGKYPRKAGVPLKLPLTGSMSTK
ncbi:16S rRNA (guanine(527)-N(7))-methyltransferase RsmG [Paenibacillus sp.]|uniref:16S rRNA (guanine(527)-N(7))-methyltransferase RsmG n=1 Tax=Paenibacillus sp. TaxID=58172 RepID=UPI002D2655D1|nr:16S rRNA (guanine(527)-N(7))-methyltransferase RsmG [Paenibacillus sp.]HZG57280.1 16S rRNA (guanine(527)-N(7))-methyltransferase RsmG [Paenibacillus sp.]